MVLARIPLPLTAKQVVDEYFIEHRTKLLDVAAFLDRLDRVGGADDDFRVRALRDAMELLLDDGPDRVERMLLAFSDPSVEPLEALDTKSAYGAFDARREG